MLAIINYIERSVTLVSEDPTKPVERIRTGRLVGDERPGSVAHAVRGRGLTRVVLVGNTAEYLRENDAATYDAIKLALVARGGRFEDVVERVDEPA